MITSKFLWTIIALSLLYNVDLPAASQEGSAREPVAAETIQKPGYPQANEATIPPAGPQKSEIEKVKALKGPEPKENKKKTDPEAIPKAEEPAGEFGKVDKSGVTVSVEETQSETTKPVKTKDVPPDRRWIMKFRDETGKYKKAEPMPIPWKNDEQKASCTAYLPKLKETFRQARYYSVHGDACNTARFSENFISLVKECETVCPDTFLSTIGYSDYIIRNVDLLYELGLKRCLEPVTVRGEGVSGKVRREDGSNSKQ